MQGMTHKPPPGYPSEEAGEKWYRYHETGGAAREAQARTVKGKVGRKMRSLRR